MSLQTYWNDFYANLEVPELEKPSSFAHFLMTQANVSEFAVIDWGAGNGRDSFLFAQHCPLVMAVEASPKALDIIALNAKNSEIENVYALSTLEIPFFPPLLRREKLPIIHYSRFLFHSLEDINLDSYLHFISTFSKPGDLIAAEYRSVPSANIVYEFPGHKRFFRDKLMIANKVQKAIDCVLTFEFEGTGLAKYKTENPLITRQMWRVSK